MLFEWFLFILVVVFGLAFILFENGPTWVQFSLGLPAVALAFAIFTRKLRPKLFSPEDGLAVWKQYAISLSAVVSLIAVIGGGAWYLDTYHNPGREMTETEKYISKGVIYVIIGIPIALGFLIRQLLKRKKVTGSATEVVQSPPTIKRRLGPQ